MSSSLTTMRHFTLAAGTSNLPGTVMESTQTNVAVARNLKRIIRSSIGTDHAKNRRSMRPITNLAVYVNHNKRSCQQRGQQSLPVLHKLTRLPCCLSRLPRWGAADAEIKVPPGENTELKRSPFKAWSRSVYSHTCYAYCQEFLPCLFLPFRSIHPHFFQNLSRFLLCWLWLTHGSHVGPQNKIGHPAGCRFRRYHTM